MEKRVQSLENSLNTVSKELVLLKELIAAGFTKVEANFSTLEKKTNEISVKPDRLDSSTITGLSDVGNKIESLTEEISKISEVTKYYDEMYKNKQGLN